MGMRKKKVQFKAPIKNSPPFAWCRQRGRSGLLRPTIKGSHIDPHHRRPPPPNQWHHPLQTRHVSRTTQTYSHYLSRRVFSSFHMESWIAFPAWMSMHGWAISWMDGCHHVGGGPRGQLVRENISDTSAGRSGGWSPASRESPKYLFSLSLSLSLSFFLSLSLFLSALHLGIWLRAPKP